MGRGGLEDDAGGGQEDVVAHAVGKGGMGAAVEGAQHAGGEVVGAGDESARAGEGRFLKGGQEVGDAGGSDEEVGAARIARG